MLNAGQKHRVLQLLGTAVSDVLAAVPSSATTTDMKELKQWMFKLRNAFKAATYMYSVTLQIIEKTQQPAAAPVVKAKKGKGRGSAKVQTQKYTHRDAP